MAARQKGRATGDEKHEAHSNENPAPEAGMSRDTINIGANMMKAGIVIYSPEEQDLIEWFWGYTFDVLRGSKAAMVRELGLDFLTIYNVLTGRHEGSLDNFCAAVERLKEKAAQNSSLVETIVTRRIVSALDYARDFRAMISITGPTGRGKTYTATQWARDNNHGRSRYVRIPSGCTRRTLVMLLCQSSGIGVNGKKTGELEMRLFKAFDQRNVIIADECGHLLPRCGTNTSAIELLRDLHDMCSCGVAMIFTDVYLKELKNGRMSDYFEQFMGRIKYGVEIPPIRRDEIRSIVNHFAPEAPADMIAIAAQIAKARDGKLRTLFEDLERARDFSAKQGVKFDAKALKQAAAWRTSGGYWPEDI